MHQLTHQISLKTTGRRLYDITPAIQAWAANSGMHTGMLTLYIQHTSASLLINENYDAEVLVDWSDFLPAWYRMAMHCLSILQKARTTCLRMCAVRLRRPAWPFLF